MAQALPLPGAFVDDPKCQANWETLQKVWPGNKTQLATVAAAVTQDFTIDATARIAVIEFAVETSAYCELHMFPNALGTAIYSYATDGSYMAGAAAAVAAAGVAGDVNGIRLSLPPAVGAAGGVQITGSAVFNLWAPSTANRQCIAKTAVSSLAGGGGHLTQLQNIASKMASNAALTTLRFATSAGTMTGYIRVTTS